MGVRRESSVESRLGFEGAQDSSRLLVQGVRIPAAAIQRAPGAQVGAVNTVRRGNEHDVVHSGDGADPPGGECTSVGSGIEHPAAGVEVRRVGGGPQLLAGSFVHGDPPSAIDHRAVQQRPRLVVVVDARGIHTSVVHADPPTEASQHTTGATLCRPQQVSVHRVDAMSDTVLLADEQRVLSGDLAEHRCHSEVGVFTRTRRTVRVANAVEARHRPGIVAGQSTPPDELTGLQVQCHHRLHPVIRGVDLIASDLPLSFRSGVVAAVQLIRNLVIVSCGDVDSSLSTVIIAIIVRAASVGVDDRTGTP